MIKMVEYKISFFLLFIIVITFILPVMSYSYDNEKTHRDLTDVAAKKSNLDIFLKSNLHFQNGLETLIMDPISGMAPKIKEWMQYGAYAEDVPNCRASSHFHNPLLSWDKSFSYPIRDENGIWRVYGF